MFCGIKVFGRQKEVIQRGKIPGKGVSIAIDTVGSTYYFVNDSWNVYKANANDI